MVQQHKLWIEDQIVMPDKEFWENGSLRGGTMAADL
jgi:hypothetical protein